mgnify:CR=1 FL=1|tara:strand:- start:1318 stop:3348 length:2031 start_codon:yes stop_codon:yes gene_type:complete
MSEERVAAAGSQPITQASIRSLAGALADADLPALFDAAAHDLRAQTSIALAAAHLGRPLDGDRLAALLPDVLRWESVLLLLGTGDRPKLLRALVEAPWTSLEHRACAVALMLHDEPEATGLVRMELRQMLRAELPSHWHDELILATARRQREHDPHVATLYERATANMPELHPEAIALPGRLAKEVAKADLSVLPEHAERRDAAEAPKAGRNDPCPCGSGKKFKKCCGAPGAAPKTTPEDEGQRLRPDLHGSPDALAERPLGELARLPMDELAIEALDTVVSTLARWRHLPGLERALAARVARPEPLADAILGDALVTFASHQTEPTAVDASALAERIDRADLRRVVRESLAAAAPQTREHWALIDAACRDAMAAEPRMPLDAAMSLMPSHPGIASMLLRGLALDAHPDDGNTAAAFVALARDFMGAPPDDPLPGVLRLLDKDDARAFERANAETEAERARRALEAQVAELRAAMRETRQRSERLEAELDAERHALSELEAAAEDESAPEVDPEELRRLRAKVRELKGRIDEGNRERSALRRDLETATTEHERSDVEGEPNDADDDEDDVAGDEDLGTSTRLRIPEWSARARKSLTGLPNPIAQSAITLAAELAVGDPLARRGAKKLEGFENLRRARVGIHYRLLYVLHDETLEVVDVLARENLDAHLGRYRKSIG